METADCLDYQRIHQASLRETETEVKTAYRLDYKRIHQASLRENETEVERADHLDYKRIHQAYLRENETKGEQKVRLKSMTSTYEKKKHSSLRGILIFLNSIFHLKLVIPWLMNNQ